jgi:nucleoside-diphosphate-sugar epimerase
LKGDAAVVETDTLEPVSDYNKTKMCAERILLSYADKMAIQIIRPATVCGVSPRQRLDVMVNMLTAQALSTRHIQAHCGEHGGGLMRPNCHIEDATDLYCWILERPQLTGCYNAGFENVSALNTAKMIAEQVEAEIEITPVKDKRSYAVNSDKLLRAGFKPRHSVREAISDIVTAWKAGKIVADDRMMNLCWMQRNRLAA